MTIEKPITVDELKVLSLLFDDEVWNKHNFAIVTEMLDPDFVENNPVTFIPGPASFKEYAARFLQAFPDTAYVVEDIFGYGDKVAKRWTVSATHRGSLFGEQPTGKKITFNGLGIYRFVGGRLAESWVSFDQFDLRKQLGIVTPPAK